MCVRKNAAEVSHAHVPGRRPSGHVLSNLGECPKPRLAAASRKSIYRKMCAARPVFMYSIRLANSDEMETKTPLSVIFSSTGPDRTCHAAIRLNANANGVRTCVSEKYFSRLPTHFRPYRLPAKRKTGKKTLLFETYL